MKKGEKLKVEGRAVNKKRSSEEERKMKMWKRIRDVEERDKKMGSKRGEMKKERRG